MRRLDEKIHPGAAIKKLYPTAQESVLVETLRHEVSRQVSVSATIVEQIEGYAKKRTTKAIPPFLLIQDQISTRAPTFF
jgi:hypothetical protein